MIRLEVADLVVIAGQVLGLDTAGVLDMLSLAAAERALAQVRPDYGPDNLSQPAADLLCAIVQEQPLQRGNWQVAFAAALQFLALNGMEVDLGPAKSVVTMISGVAAGTLSAWTVGTMLATRMRPVGSPVASAKEEPVRVRARSSLPFRKVAVRSRSGETFGRFTDPARQAVFHASQEARLLRHRHLGTEHLLLGLVFDDAGLAAQALESLGLSLGDVRYQVTQITGHGEHAPPEHIPFTPQAKRALELSLREALSLGHNNVGTEHLLLGLLKMERGIAALVLTRLGADYGRVRDRVAELTNLRDQADREAQEGRQPTRAELADVGQQLDRIRMQKEDALSAEDFEAALALRDREKELLATKTRLERQLAATPQAPDMLAAVLEENQRLHRELDRPRRLLRDRGIEPEGGTARPA